jgi:bifunctional DNase/RNase
MIPVRLSRIVIREGVEQQWIFLSERDGHRGFPIIIGANEAAEIQRVVTREQPRRPLTHQLALDLVQSLGAKVQRVDIVDLRENTFFAQIVLRDESRELSAVVDARPSDALALALRTGCPIQVAESVLEQARTDEGGPDALPET